MREKKGGLWESRVENWFVSVVSHYLDVSKEKAAMLSFTQMNLLFGLGYTVSSSQVRKKQLWWFSQALDSGSTKSRKAASEMIKT